MGNKYDFVRIVIGPPGTGKTTYLSRQANRCVDRHGTRSALVASLTRTAAAEVAGRRTKMSPECIGTLHAHCYRALGHPTIAESKIADWNNRHPQEAILRVKAARLDDAAIETPSNTNQNSGDALYGKYSRLRAAMVDRKAWPDRATIFAEKWESWKRENDLMDFEDLIQTCLSDGVLPAMQPSVLYGDESQDFSKSEVELALAWGQQAGGLVVVGDPDQTIYEWRAADPHAFTRLGIHHEHRRVLEQSYRVPRAVHATAVKWISRIRDREQVTYYPRDEQGEVVFRSAFTWQSPEFLVRDAERRADAGQTVMILASCAYLLQPTIAVLRRRGLPFHNPYRKTNGAWNPLAPRRGTTAADRVLAFLAHGERGCWTLRQLCDWTVPCTSAGFLSRGAKKAMEESCREKRLALMELADHDVAGYFSGGEWRDAIRAADSCDLPWLESHLTPVKRKHLAYALKVAGMRGHAALKDEPKICVGTIHSTKGGEADAVFLIPELSASGYRQWNRDRDPVVRLFYVGMTRARESLVLCGAGSRRHVPLVA